MQGGVEGCLCVTSNFIASLHLVFLFGPFGLLASAVLRKSLYVISRLQLWGAVFRITRVACSYVGIRLVCLCPS